MRTSLLHCGEARGFRSERLASLTSAAAQCGFAMLSVGAIRAKNVKNMLLYIIMVRCAVCVAQQPASAEA